MADIVQIRRDSTDNWQSVNPILADGEIGFNTTNRKLKIGNGATAWNNLLYTVDDVPTNLSEFINDINYDDRYFTETEIAMLLNDKVTIPTQAEWDNFRLTLQG